MSSQTILIGLLVLAAVANLLSGLSKIYPNSKTLKVIAGVVAALSAMDIAKFSLVVSSNEAKAAITTFAALTSKKQSPEEQPTVTEGETKEEKK